MKRTRISYFCQRYLDRFEHFCDQFERRSAKHYRGFSREYVRLHDPQSLLIERIDDSTYETLAAVRLIFATLGASGGPLPMEMGDLGAFSPPETGNIAEASGFFYTELADGLLLLQDVAGLLKDHHVERLYALYDPRHPITPALYMNTIKMSPIPDAAVVFSGFRRLVNDEPVRWSVASADKHTFIRAQTGLIAA